MDSLDDPTNPKDLRLAGWITNVFIESRDSVANPDYTNNLWFPFVKHPYLMAWEHTIEDNMIPTVIYNELRLNNEYIGDNFVIFLN